MTSRRHGGHGAAAGRRRGQVQRRDGAHRAPRRRWLEPGPLRGPRVRVRERPRRPRRLRGAGAGGRRLRAGVPGLSRKGFDFIIGTSFGYMDPMATVAEEFPDTTYLHLTGYKSNGTNFGNFFGAMEDFKYLAGHARRARAPRRTATPSSATWPRSPSRRRSGWATRSCWAPSRPAPSAPWTCASSTPGMTRSRSATAPPRCSTRARRSCSPARTRRPWRRSPARRASGASPMTTPPPASSTRASRRPTGSGVPSTPGIAEQVKAGTYTPATSTSTRTAGAMGLFGFMDGGDAAAGHRRPARGGRAAGQGHPRRDARGRVQPLRRVRRRPSRTTRATSSSPEGGSWSRAISTSSLRAPPARSAPCA